MNQPDGEAIARAGAALDQSLMAGSAAEIAGHFTEDGILGESGMADLVGRAAIRDFLARANQVRTVVHHRLHRDELVMVDGDRAIEYGRFDETKVKPGEAPIEERGRTVTDWRRGADGVWRIARLVVSDLP
jgi:ketosteroid isomerase-like protein